MLAVILLHISIYEMRQKERFIISSNKSILSLNVFCQVLPHHYFNFYLRQGAHVIWQLL